MRASLIVPTWRYSLASLSFIISFTEQTSLLPLRQQLPDPDFGAWLVAIALHKLDHRHLGIVLPDHLVERIHDLLEVLIGVGTLPDVHPHTRSNQPTLR